MPITAIETETEIDSTIFQVRDDVVEVVIAHHTFVHSDETEFEVFVWSDHCNGTPLGTFATVEDARTRVAEIVDGAYDTTLILPPR